ncbi:hypothetical protein K502DRAFT_362812 [Neoconidiobolus thromboides FSU 785]|nr:hypothetical protein K502DRAFT_362812 [Neoconidiobolus thromboides FSU 785]
MTTPTILNLKVKELKSLETKLKSLSTNKPLITASPLISVKEALRLMAINDILCLPIQSHNNSEKVVNLVNLLDILIYLVSGVEKVVPIVSKNRTTLHSGNDLPQACYQKMSSTIEQVMTLDNSRESYRLCTCDLEDYLYDVVKTFSSGIHRAVVLKNDKPFYIITQMDILRHLYSDISLLPKNIDYKSSLEQLGLAKVKEMTLVKKSTIALNAYQLMATNKFTSIVVVDEETGQLLSNLSASSLRGISQPTLESLLLPVQEFMKKSLRGIRPLVYGEPSMSFEEAIKKMVEMNVHHLWLVDENQKPYSTVSPYDIFKLFF